MSDADDRKDLWMDVKREYAEIFQMGRRIWRRPTHPSRLRVVYDMAMLCIRFNDIPVSYKNYFNKLSKNHRNFNWIFKKKTFV